jgi:hypothetical protein
MKKFYAISICFALVLGIPWICSAQNQPSNLSKLMIEKLNSSKILLEGIALGDFKKIDRSAETLIQLSKTAEWFVYKTPRYELHSNEFRRAAENILLKSKDKNLDGVTLAYFDLTMACVRCHQYVREVRDARLPLLREHGFALTNDKEKP